MSQPMSFDPFALWKQMYDKAEEQWSQNIDETMHKEEFSKWMGQYLNGYLQYQNLARQSSEKYLEQANLPSRQDISNVAGLVVNLESKVDNLEQVIEEDIVDLLKQADLAKEVKNIKSDIAKMSKRLDQLFELLEAKTEVAASKEIPSKDPATTQKK